VSPCGPRRPDSWCCVLGAAHRDFNYIKFQLYAPRPRRREAPRRRDRQHGSCHADCQLAGTGLFRPSWPSLKCAMASAKSCVSSTAINRDSVCSASRGPGSMYSPIIRPASRNVAISNSWSVIRSLRATPSMTPPIFVVEVIYWTMLCGRRIAFYCVNAATRRRTGSRSLSAVLFKIRWASRSFSKDVRFSGGSRAVALSNTPFMRVMLSKAR
jgi:hypothetical protein